MKYIRLFLFILIPLLMMACNRGKNNPGYDYMGAHDMYYTKMQKKVQVRESSPPSINKRRPNVGTPFSGECLNTQMAQDKKSRSFRLRLGCRSRPNAWASIWRMRSRVTPNFLPTSSSV